MSLFKARLNRRQLGASLALSSACLAVGAQPQETRTEKSRVNIALSSKSAFEYLPLILAEQLGYFAAEGLEVDITEHGTSIKAVQALTAGSAHVLCGAYEHTLDLQNRGLLFQSFVVLTNTPQTALALAIKTLPGYRSAADLKGKKIGVAGLGTSSHKLAVRVLINAGLKANDAIFVSMASSSVLQALRSGQIDAISYTDPAISILEQKGEVRIVADSRTLSGSIEVFGGLLPGACLLMSVEMLQKYPAMCQALTSGLVHALKWLQTAGAGDIIRTVPEAYLLGDRGLYLAIYDKLRESTSTDGMFPVAAANTALKSLSGFDASFKPEKIILAKTYTNQFAQKAKTRFKA